MPELPFRGVLFDMDGTLTPNAGFHHDSWTACLLERYAFKLGPDDPRVHGGKTRFILESLLGRTVPDDEAHAFHDWKEARYRDLARGRVKAVAGLEMYLDVLEGHGVPVAIVSSADRVNAHFVLEALGLEDRFPVRVLAEDVTRGKPDPQPFRMGAARLGLEARDCVAHEDSLIGVRSAVAAGSRVAAVTTMQPPGALLEAGATWAVADYVDWMRVLGL